MRTDTLKIVQQAVDKSGYRLSDLRRYLVRLKDFARHLQELLGDDEFNDLLDSLELGTYEVGKSSPSEGKQIPRADLVRKYISRQNADSISRELGVSKTLILRRMHIAIHEFARRLDIQLTQARQALPQGSNPIPAGSALATYFTSLPPASMDAVAGLGRAIEDAVVRAGSSADGSPEQASYQQLGKALEQCRDDIVETWMRVCANSPPATG